MKTKKKWRNYQINSGITVADLNEEQAKDELCKAIALIDKLDLETSAFVGWVTDEIVKWQSSK